MAEYRLIYTKIWDDSWFCDLDAESKVVWFYIVTNQKTSVSGLYQIKAKQIALDTNVEYSKVIDILNDFTEADKIVYDDKACVIFIRHYQEYQVNNSSKITTKINKDVDAIPDCKAKYYYCKQYGIDTVSIGYQYGIDDTDTDTDTDTESNTNTNIPIPKANLATNDFNNTNLPLCQWFFDYTQKRPSNADRELETSLQQLPNYDPDKALTAIREITSKKQEREHGWKPGALVYFKNPLMELFTGKPKTRALKPDEVEYERDGFIYIMDNSEMRNIYGDEKDVKYLTNIRYLFPERVRPV